MYSWLSICFKLKKNRTFPPTAYELYLTLLFNSLKAASAAECEAYSMNPNPFDRGLLSFPVRVLSTTTFACFTATLPEQTK